MSIANPPEMKTVSYGLAPGAVDEDIDVQSEEMLVNMGPQHPSTHGVLRIVLRTDGEMVLEKLANIEVPQRSEYISTIAVELNLISSHLVSFGTYGMDMGAFTPFLY